MPRVARLAGGPGEVVTMSYTGAAGIKSAACTLGSNGKVVPRHAVRCLFLALAFHCLFTAMSSAFHCLVTGLSLMVTAHCLFHGIPMHVHCLFHGIPLPVHCLGSLVDVLLPAHPCSRMALHHVILCALTHRRMNGCCAGVADAGGRRQACRCRVLPALIAATGGFSARSISLRDGQGQHA